MFNAQVEAIEAEQIIRYVLLRNGAELSFSNVLELWQSDFAFQDYFSQLLADSPFPAFRWETPALAETTENNPFEFVLINYPGFCSRETDAETYNKYFTESDVDSGVVSFANLRGDATLVVPSPRTGIKAYGHLAAFVRHAPRTQVNALWRVVARSAIALKGNSPIWLSTAGGGVAWLHVRLDGRPKYYFHLPYKTLTV